MTQAQKIQEKAITKAKQAVQSKLRNGEKFMREFFEVIKTILTLHDDDYIFKVPSNDSPNPDKVLEAKENE